MYLVLVESPTKTKTLEKFLGKDYKVLASYGHVRDLPKSKLGIDVENNFEPQYIIPQKARKNVKAIKEALKNADFVYLATDPDREGEAISFHLLSALGIKEYKRITFNEITKNAVEEATKNPRLVDMDLVDAQQARRVLDRLVGYKLSPLLWKKISRGLSAGRVQSVALRIVTDREKEIDAFKKEEYWSISVLLGSTEGEFVAELKEKNKEKLKKPGIEKQEEAEEIKNDLEGASYVVNSITQKEKKRNPLPPFTTSTMQQEAFKRLRFPSSFTMRVAQSLYEKGLITYHRTDSLHLSIEAKKAGEDYIKNAFGENYHKERNFSAKGKTQEAHEAIRPSVPENTPEKTNGLKPEEKKLYDLIWRRFIASLMSEAIFYSTGVEIEAKNQNSYLLSSNGSVLQFDGFTKVYPVKFEENELPKVKENEELEKKSVEATQHFTNPPARFTEATLIKELEKYGVGRPSTYAPTLFTLSQRNYTEKIEKKYLKPTEIGIVVSNLLIEHFPFIVDFKFTAKMEEDLDEIAEGKKEWRSVIKAFYDDFEKTLKIKEVEIKKEDIMSEKTNEKCEKCGGELIIRMGRFGKFFACKNFPDCKFTKPIKEDGVEGKDEEEEKEDVICDKCGAKMQIKHGRFGEFYGCSNYPECKNIKSKGGDLNIKCPECKEGDVVMKKSGKGKTFYACSRYPDCKFTSSKKPSPIEEE
jgi:DNA topoisomerase-1